MIEYAIFSKDETGMTWRFQYLHLNLKPITFMRIHSAPCIYENNLKIHQCRKADNKKGILRIYAWMIKNPLETRGRRRTRSQLRMRLWDAFFS